MARQAVVLVLLLLSVPAVASEPDSASLEREIKSRRIQADVPPWPQDWDPAQVSCERTWQAPFEREVRVAYWVAWDCGSEAVGIATTISSCVYGVGLPTPAPIPEVTLRTVAEALGESIWQRVKVCIQAGGTSLEAAGYTITAVKCSVKAALTAEMNLQGYSPERVEAMRKTVDAAADAASLLKAARESVTTAIEEGGREPAKGLAPDAVGTGDTWEKLREAWLSWEDNQVTSIRMGWKDVERLIEECRFDAAQARMKALEDEKQKSILRARSQLLHYEQRVFCDARAGTGEARARVEASGFYSSMVGSNKWQRDARAQFDEIANPAEFERRLAAKRIEMDVLTKSATTAINRVPAALEACDVAGLESAADSLRRFLAEPCTQASGMEPAVRERLRVITEALDLKRDLGGQARPLLAEVETLIGSCQFGEAALRRQKLQSLAEDARMRGHGLNLPRCADLSPWPDEAWLRATVEDKERALNEHLKDLRRAQETATKQRDQCEFQLARDTVAAALAVESCPLPASPCTPAEPACTLTALRDDLSRLLPSIDEFEKWRDEQRLKLETEGARLRTEGEEALQAAQPLAPGRCAAADRVRQAAEGLKALRVDLLCLAPLVEEFQAEGKRLLSSLAQAEAALRDEWKRRWRLARAAAKDCRMADLQLGLATLDELTGQFCGPLPDDPAPLRARLDEIETFTRDAATILSEIERDVAEWERTCEAGALKATQARYSNIWDCGIKNVAPEVASRLQSVWQTAEHADDAQKKAARVRKQAEAALDKAEAHADDARTRLSLGVRSAEARVRMQAEVHKAEEALERARTLVVDTGAKFDLPDSCLRDVMQKIAAAEAQIPGVPSGDMAEVPPRATTPPEGPREEEDPEVAGLIEEAKAAVKACRLQEALSIAREIERRAPGHPWLGLNMGRIESLADRQRLVVAAISAGRGSLSSGDTKGAMAHARRAASAPPPSCMADGVTDYVRLVGDVARKQAEEARAAAREASQRAAAAAAEALIGLAQVAQRVANRNRGTAPTAAPPRGDSSQRGNGQGGDSCAGRYHYVSEWNFTPECDCPGYTWNGQACVGSGGGRQDGGDRSDNRGTGGNHAILRIDRRYEETAVCGDPPYTVRLHSFTAYFKGTRDRLGQITAELGVGRNPGGWRKSGPCNCANWQTDSASTVQDNLSAQDAQSQWDRLPGQSWNFEVAIGKLAGAPGDNSTHRLNAAPCSMR